MPLIQRFTTTANGAMILAGNTLSCRTGAAYPASYPNDYDNGSYISTNSALIAAPGFPNGTTFNPTQSSSTAVVSIPAGSTVLYAQLSWCMTPIGSPLPNQDDPITFLTPTTTSIVNPDLSLKQSDGLSIIWQAIDVTTLVNDSGGGTYEVQNVPGQTAVDGGTIIANGWQLVVVYSNSNFEARYFNVNSGLAFVSQTQPSDFEFSNFETPALGPIKSYFLVSGSYGDLLDGSQIYIGPTSVSNAQVGNTSTIPWNGLAPYAQINNMLPGNILIADANDPNIGLLDTRGTFGTYNKDPFNTTAPPFARANHDILGLDISSELTNSQTTLFTRVTYTGTGFSWLTSQSVQIDINSPNFTTSTKSADKNYIDVEETLTYTFVVRNTGSIQSNNTLFIDTIPSSLTFVPGSMVINGSSTIANPASPGIDLGPVGINSPVTLTYQAIANTIANPNPAINYGEIIYDYISIGTTTVVGEFTPDPTTTTIVNAHLDSSKEVNKNFADVGDILVYTIPIINSGNTSATNVVFIDTVPNNTSLVPGSFVQDGTPIPGSPSYATLPNVIPGFSVSTVTFQVRIDTVPSPNPIPNSATTVYTYTIDNTAGPVTTGSGNTHTNIVTTTVNNASISNFSKSVNTLYATCGEILTYTISVPNTGNVTATNVIISDTIPNGTILVPGSILVNGTSVGGTTSSINIGTIPVGTTSTVSFKVQVNC